MYRSLQRVLPLAASMPNSDVLLENTALYGQLWQLLCHGTNIVRLNIHLTAQNKVSVRDDSGQVKSGGKLQLIEGVMV